MNFFLNKKNVVRHSKLRPAGRIKPAYYSGSAKTPSDSPSNKKTTSKRSFRLRAKYFFNVLLLTLIVAGVVFCSILKPTPEMVVSDTSYHSTADYETAVSSALKAVRNRTKLTLDRNGISAVLKKQFPELNSIRIEVPVISQIPTVRLNVAAPTFNFTSGGNLFVVGSNGVVATKSAQLAGSSKLPTLIDQSGFEVSPGKQVLSSQGVAFINSLIAQIKRAKVVVSSLTLPASPAELDLQAAGSAYFVKFDLDNDAVLQAGQYLAAKHKFDEEGGGPGQYLDVRVAGKIYYK